MPEESCIKQYLGMQREKYQVRASHAVVDKNGVVPDTDQVVGNYLAHSDFPYDANILKFFKSDPAKCSILEYGCGPGRNLIRLSKIFNKVAGVDISETNIFNAKKLLDFNNVKSYSLHVTPGDSITIPDEKFDVVFEVICLQHICSYTIRKRILSEMARVCGTDGIVVCQFGFNEWPLKNPEYVDYYEDRLLNVKDTNGWADCCVGNENQVIGDFKDIGLCDISVWYTDKVADFWHDKWIWVGGRKAAS